MSDSIKGLVAQANTKITNHEAEHAAQLVENNQAIFVDVREEDELESAGKIPGSKHAPRGLLEFFIDPNSPKYDKFFTQDKEFIFYCAGGPRGALAAKTAQEMGLKRVSNLTGGYNAWKET